MKYQQLANSYTKLQQTGIDRFLKYLRPKQQTQGVKYSKQIALSKCLCCKIKQERLHQYCCPRQVATLIRMAGLFVQLASKFGRLIKYGQANTPC